MKPWTIERPGFKPWLPNNCAIAEHTADGAFVGRCFFYLHDGVCERHGNVSEAQRRYVENGTVTNDYDLPREASK